MKRIAIVHHSAHGHTEHIARCIGDGIQQVADLQVGVAGQFEEGVLVHHRAQPPVRTQPQAAPYGVVVGLEPGGVVVGAEQGESGAADSPFDGD